MTDLNDLMAHVPVDQLAHRLGVDRATAEAAVRQALPALVGGMSANAQDPAGAASLAGALTQHDPGLLDGDVSLDRIDERDGEKIVGHVFGDNRGHVVRALGAQTPAGAVSVPASLIAKLLPLLAPIVMSYLAKRLGKATGGAGGASNGAVLAEILATVLREATASKEPTGDAKEPSGDAAGRAGGFDLGSILGGLGELLGRGRR